MADRCPPPPGWGGVTSSGISCNMLLRATDSSGDLPEAAAAAAAAAAVYGSVSSRLPMLPIIDDEGTAESLLREWE